MLTLNELVDLRMQEQIAHEIYRQQIMQRIPDPFPSIMPMRHGMPPDAAAMAAAVAAHQMLIPPARPSLPGCEAKLENKELWQQFHKIGTEMIITKSGRRMFPSMRVSLAGLEDEDIYCVFLEMVPVGDCRFKFSGSQWVPAGGPEPQSPQRMYLHPDSPATGSHWKSQALLFNKVKLTNNTLDSNGHIVLASMHKYQPRLHVVRSSDLTQLPWAPQQAFVFPETEFVAVTAYQNERITQLKIDNNPFAKGFRETGQSRCKRKQNVSATIEDSGTEEPKVDNHSHELCRQTSMSSLALSVSDDDLISVCSSDSPPKTKRLRTLQCQEDNGYVTLNSSCSSASISPHFDEMPDTTTLYMQQYGHYNTQIPKNLASYLSMPMSMARTLPKSYVMLMDHQIHSSKLNHYSQHHQLESIFNSSMETPANKRALTNKNGLAVSPAYAKPVHDSTPKPEATTAAKRSNFSISAILSY